jgi:excinuclease UvrABC ATPase subunit
MCNPELNMPSMCDCTEKDRRIAELEKWKQWADEDAIQRNQENQRLRTKLEAAEALLGEREEKQTYWFRKATQYSILLDEIAEYLFSTKAAFWERVEFVEAILDKREQVSDKKEQVSDKKERVSDKKATERIAELEAENVTFRNAQKACETCDGPTIAEFKELKTLLDEILDAEIPWAHGDMKLRHMAVVKAILDNRRTDNELS